MKMNVTRRDVLRFAGGSAIGVALSPMPWKLTDDLAVWTQNWSWIPVPPKGEPSVRTTVCALCPAGCSVRARCIGGAPVSLHAAPSDPVSGGALCPLGVTGHHLAYHPARLSHPVRVVRKDGTRRRLPVQPDAAVTETARALAAAAAGLGSVVVLDMRPGRSASWGWRRLLAGTRDGRYVAPPGRAGAGLATFAGMIGSAEARLGLDLEGARTILSFGAPLAEGWGTPGRTAAFLDRRGCKKRLVQVDAVRTSTAGIADRWLPAKPGTEAVLALGLGHVLLAEGLIDAQAGRRLSDLSAYAALVAPWAPEAVAEVTGLGVEAIVATARELAKQGPSLVLAGEDGGCGRFGRATETAIWALNLLLAAPWRPGCLVARGELPPPALSGPLAPSAEVEELPDRSVALLVLDGSAGDAAFPWSLVERKLIAEGGLVVALSPFLAGTAMHADLVVPTLPFLEATLEVPTPFDATAATFAVAAPLMTPRSGAVDPLAFAGAVVAAAGGTLVEGWGTTAALSEARADAIQRAGRGTLSGPGESAPRAVAALSSPGGVWKALVAGARWVDDAVAAPAERSHALLGGAGDELRVLARPGGAATRLVVLPRAPRDVTASAAVSPVLAKLYRESGLRRSPSTVVVNPETARKLGLAAGCPARLESDGGTLRVTVATDAGVMPGVIVVPVGPNAVALGDRGATGRAGVLDVLTADEAGVWRGRTARLVEA
jgi:menaquinone reductase, molybdopterin-binding-like subunit